MKIRIGLIAIAATMTLTGCMTAEELRARDEQTCRDYGFRKRNDAFAQCLQRIELDRRAQSRVNQIALADMERDFWYRNYWYRPHYHRPRPPRPPKQ